MTSRSPISCLPASKAAFAGKCRRVCDVSFLQAWLDLRESHFPAALGTGSARYGRVGRLGRYKHAKPAFDFIVKTRNAFTQFVASRQHDPATLDVEVFGFIDLVGRSRSPRSALARPFVAISDLM